MDISTVDFIAKQAHIKEISFLTDPSSTLDEKMEDILFD
jgi:hypothetical protein